MDVDQLRKQFAAPGVEIAAGEGGFPKLSVQTSVSTAEIYLHGAHVTHFAPKDEPPLLFMSRHSRYEDGKAIRGGVPLIFPWFGPNAADRSLPAHGFARTRMWELAGVSQEDGGVVAVRMALGPDAGSRILWPREFRVTFTVRVGKSLQMSMQVDNRDDKPFRFEEAMHTYLRVSDIRTARVDGLGGRHYLDRVDHGLRKTQVESPFGFTGETDRTYMNTPDTVIVTDPTGSAVGGPRVIAVGKSNSADTVVWNPWIAKAVALADLGDDEWPNLLCIETANTGDNALTLEPGGSHTMSAVIELV